MKITLFATLALSAVVGLALADDMFNNWNNDDGGFGGVIGGMSGGMGHIGGGYSSGGFGSGYGSGSGYSSGYASGYGSGSGYGGMQAQYVPVPVTGGNAGSGIGSLLPLVGLLFLLPLLSQGSTGTQDQIILLNTTLEG